MYLILTRMVETVHRTNSTILFHFLIPVCSTIHSNFSLRMRKAWKWNELWVALIFLFFLYHFQYHVLTNAEENEEWEKGLIGFLAHLCFFKCHCLLSGLEAKFWFKREVWPLGPVNVLVSSVLDVTYLPYPSFEAQWTLTHHRSNGILCLWRHLEYHMQIGWQAIADILGVSSLLSHILQCSDKLHLQNAGSKRKLIRISRQRQQHIKLRAGLLKGPHATNCICHILVMPPSCT